MDEKRNMVVIFGIDRDMELTLAVRYGAKTTEG